MLAYRHDAQMRLEMFEKNVAFLRIDVYSPLDAPRGKMRELNSSWPPLRMKQPKMRESMYKQCDVKGTAKPGMTSIVFLLACVASFVAHGGEPVAGPLPGPPLGPEDSLPWVYWYDRIHDYPKRLPRQGKVTIAPWRGDRAAAWTFVFDDGRRDQLELAVPILDKAGLQGSFMVNPGSIVDSMAEAEKRFAELLERLRKKAPDVEVTRDRLFMQCTWDEWKAVAAKGHEIGNHGMTHTGVGNMAPDGPELRREVLEARDRITQRIGKRCLSFCGPYGDPSNEKPVRLMVERWHVATTGGERLGYGGGYPRKAENGDYLGWYNQRFDRVTAGGRWARTMIHGITVDVDPIGEEIFRKHVEYVAAARDRVWVDTLANIGRYAKQASSAELQVNWSDGRAEIVLKCPLSAEIYNVPLTVVLEVKAASAEAKRGASVLPVTLKAGKILVDAAPGAEPIIVQWK